jgi:hypothetical protein
VSAKLAKLGFRTCAVMAFMICRDDQNGLAKVKVR